MKHLLLLITAVALATAGCGSFPDSSRVEAAPAVAAAPAREAVQGHGGLRPVRVACVQDKTGSAAFTRTPKLTCEDLAPVIDLLRERGGELAVGIIHSSVRMGMARIRVDRPPAPPRPPSSAAGNPLDQAEQESVQHDDQLAFVKKLSVWETDVNNRLAAFHSELKRLLSVPSNSRSSPVWSAVARADLFLAESDTSWPEPPAAYGVLLSDGEDNTVHSAPSLSARATWIIVNGDGRIGSLGALKASRFESIRAAFADVIARERRK